MTKIITDREALKLSIDAQADEANRIYEKYENLQSQEYNIENADRITRELKAFDNYTKELLKRSFSGTIETNEYLKEFSEIIHMNDNLTWLPIGPNPNVFGAEIISKQVILRNMNEYLSDLSAKINLIPEEVESNIPTTDANKDEISILILSSNPEDQDPLNYGREHREIRERIGRSTESYRVKIHDRTAVRDEDIINSLNETNPDFIHISGHGDNKSLAIQNHNGETVDLTSEMLKAALSSSENLPKIVLLSACDSSDIANSLTDTVPIAIGMNAPIGDDVAIVFASQFYSSLAFGKSLSTAFKQGKAAILMQGLEDGIVPQLFTNDETDEKEYKPMGSSS